MKISRSASRSRDGIHRGLAELKTYEAKRKPDESPEPFTSTTAGGARFVVQKHAARRLHYDLRLEHDGVLLSWAVPQGPCRDPKVKRLAVRTEDHPVDYADFEGIIPAGNYGAGSMIVWDQGRFSAAEDFAAGLERGKLLFDLHGHKLHGRWTLVRTRRKGARTEEWLLIKKPDGWARPADDEPLPEVSVLSGLRVEELAHRRDRLQALRAEVDDAPESTLTLDAAELMLAQTAETPFDDEGWWFELKYDGFRLLAEKRDAQVSLRYRRGKRVNDIFPDLVRALSRLPVDHALLDGEVVVLDDEAVPRFQLLQRRVQLTRSVDIARASLRHPVTYYAFDVLAFEGRDLRSLPLHRRKEILQHVVPRLGPVRFADHVPARGRAFFAEVERRGLEGLVAKRHDAPYRPGRSRDWLKLPCRRKDELVIVGYTPPRGSRTGFGGLHLAHGADGELTYAGRVGSGFDDHSLAELASELSRRARPTSPLAITPQVPPGTVWVEPELVCDVRYLNRTDEGLLRQPVFLGLRPDRTVRDLIGEPPSPGDDAADAPRDRAPSPPHDPHPNPRKDSNPGSKPNPGPGGSRITVTNPDKVFFPESGITKAELVDYYRAVSSALLPFLNDRPVVLTRYPDGIDGKSFFQKNAPPHTPDWIRQETVWSEHAEREIDYLILDSEDAVAFAINAGSIPLHVWASRTASLQTPDWLVLDLDPKSAPFTDVVILARSAHRLCRDIGLDAYCKTSGSTGLHVLVPLARRLRYEAARQLAELMARVLVDLHPEIATIDRVLQARKGRVYIDYVQNGHGRLLVAPFSVRPLPGAPVSTPVHWREVTAKLQPRQFDLRSLPRRLARQRKDPWEGFLEVRPDLGAALDALRERLER